MQTTETITGTREILHKIRGAGKTVGFVPTMGALHEGHLALVEKSKKENDYTAVSIFVNPIQFNNTEDLAKYPRTIEDDIIKLQNCGCDLLFNPSADEMYPEPDTQKFDFGHLEKVMEGTFRPGHFNGVAVVVKKLFEIIAPDRAYFGQKDFQQLVIVQHLVEQYKIPVEIVPCPTVREPDGLAMSSRNKRLSPGERKIAPGVCKIISAAGKMFLTDHAGNVKKWVEEQFALQKEFRLEYFEISLAKDLLPAEKYETGNKYVVCVAAYLGKVRLIDNVIINS